MCFSATASFAASAALLPAGSYCVTQAVKKNKDFLPLSFVPFAFSIQQFCEGLVWLGLGDNNGALAQTASVVYLFFAMAFWPFWIPFSVLWTETRVRRKLVLEFMAALSLAWTWLYLPIAIAPERWLTTEVVHHSIRYNFWELPGFQLAPPVAWRLVYLLLVSIPLVMGCTRGELTPRGQIWSLLAGLTLVASFVVSYFAFWYAFTSVWCFFAALLAILLCYVFHQLPEAVSRERRATNILWPGTS